MTVLRSGIAVLLLSLTTPHLVAEGKFYKFDLDLEGVVGGKNLRSSTYRVVIKCGEDGKGTVSFYDGPRLAAQVACNMVTTDTEADFYGVTYTKDPRGKKVVSTIFLKGEKEKVVLDSGN